MTNRTGQSAIQAIAISGTRQTSATGGGGAGTGIKWHPGHYLMISSYMDGNTTLGSPTNLSSLISEISGMATIKGCLAGGLWGALEGDVEGNYTAGFALVDAILAACQASGKRLILVLRRFYISTGSVDYQVSQKRFPAYLRDTYSGIYQDTVSGTVDVKFWLPAVNARMTALHAAYAARYDTHPYFEGFSTCETEGSTHSPDFSQAAKVAAIKTSILALETQWLHTNVMIQADSGISSLADRQSIIDYMYAHRMMLSGPDIRPNDYVSGGAGGTNFQRVYRGPTAPGNGTTDYRGLMACGFEVQGNNLGGNHTPTAAILDPTTTLDFIYDKALNTLESSHHIWNRKTVGISSGGTDNDIFWDTAASGYTNNHPTIKEWLTQSAATIPVVTTPPTNYAASGTDTS